MFDGIVARLEEGEPTDVEGLIRARPDLRGRVQELVELAHAVVGHDPAPGAAPIVPGYRLLHEVGRGGMGTVYLATQESLGGRKVALKVLPREMSLSARARDRFSAEANAIARLHHPNIVAIHDVCQHRRVQAFAMEWIEGSSLSRLIDALGAARASTTSHSRRGDPGVARMQLVRDTLGCSPGTALERTWTQFVCRVGIQIARALGAVHREGLLHRDVKPSNVLIRRDGTALLSDFGLVRDECSPTITRTEHFVGTPAYASPEQLAVAEAGAHGRGSGLDARSDVYSLGVSLYHALALALPFQGRSHAQMLHHIEFGIVAPIRNVNRRIPRDLETIVSKAMDIHPSRRYQSADELADDLERLLTLRPIRAKRAGWLAMGAKFARRNRAGVVGAAGGGVFAAAILAVVGLYVFFVPGWCRAHRDAARLALLNPGMTTVVYSSLFWGDKFGGKSLVHAGMCREALDHYDAALRLQPWDTSIRLERDCVRTALHMKAQQGESAAISDLIRRQAPVTTSYAISMPVRGRPENPLGSQELAGAHEAFKLLRTPEHLDAPDVSTTDLRCLALLAFVCKDIQTAVSAWAAIDLREPGDPVADTALGYAYLIDEQPARAYPRLLRAANAFPESSWIATAMADAAAQCGDTRLAQQSLARARVAPSPDEQALERVQITVDLSSGREGEARERYRRILVENSDLWSPVLGYAYGRWLEAHQHLGAAVVEFGRTCARGITVPYRPSAALIPIARRWWESLTPERRFRFVRGLLESDLDGDAPDNLIGLGYVRAVDCVKPGPGSREDASFEVLARRCVTGTAFTHRGFIAALPGWAKQALAVATFTDLHPIAVRLAAQAGAWCFLQEHGRWQSHPPRWRRLEHTGAPLLSDSAIATDSRRARVVVHGGYTQPGGKISGITWAWDGKAWGQVSSSQEPCRAFHSMAYDPARDRFILRGGFDAEGALALDTWAMDGSGWHRLNVPEYPGQDVRGPMVYEPSGRTVIAFAGYRALGFKRLDESGWTDSVVHGARSSWSGIESSVVVFDEARSRVLLFGPLKSALDGVGPRTVSEFDGTSWTHVAPRTVMPARNLPAVAYDPRRGRTVVYGGVIAENPGIYLTDTWEYDGATWTKTDNAGPGGFARGCMFYDAASGHVRYVGGVGTWAPTLNDAMWEYEP